VLSRTFLLAAATALAVACVSPASPPPEAQPREANGSATTLSEPPAAAPVPSPSPTPPPDPLLWAVGDIASCATDDDERVAALMRGRRGQIAILGDAVYDDGTPAEYRNCFDPAWGPMRRRLRPAPGNHDYRTPDAAGYFGYFGARAGDAGKGWYAFNMGPNWRVIVLNSQCPDVGGCHADSPQGRWLRRTLDATSGRHILAFWHVPLFSSGRHGSNASVKPFWRLLRRAGADLVLNGHDHTYERFAPQTPDGVATSDGIRQFVVGSGGFTHYEFPDPLPNSEVRDKTSFGVLRLRLEPDGYRWRFIPATGSFTDAGRQRLGAPS
jgi:hypothetical protein